MDARLREHDDFDAALSPLAPALALAFPNARRSDEGKGEGKGKSTGTGKGKGNSPHERARRSRSTDGWVVAPVRAEQDLGAVQGTTICTRFRMMVRAV